MPPPKVDELIDALLANALHKTSRGGVLHILDVGANVGQSVKRFMSPHWNPPGHKPSRVMCVEPGVSAYKQLTKVVDELHLKHGRNISHAIEAIHVAVSATESVAHFASESNANQTAPRPWQHRRACKRRSKRWR